MALENVRFDYVGRWLLNQDPRPTWGNFGIIVLEETPQHEKIGDYRGNCTEFRGVAFDHTGKAEIRNGRVAANRDAISFEKKYGIGAKQGKVPGWMQYAGASIDKPTHLEPEKFRQDAMTYRGGWTRQGVVGTFEMQYVREIQPKLQQELDEYVKQFASVQLKRRMAMKQAGIPEHPLVRLLHL